MKQLEQGRPFVQALVLGSYCYRPHIVAVPLDNSWPRSRYLVQRRPKYLDDLDPSQWLASSRFPRAYQVADCRASWIQLTYSYVIIHNAAWVSYLTIHVEQERVCLMRTTQKTKPETPGPLNLLLATLSNYMLSEKGNVLVVKITWEGTLLDVTPNDVAEIKLALCMINAVDDSEIST